MKSSHFLTLFSLLALLFFSNCGGDDPEPADDTLAIITARVNNENFSASGLLVTAVLNEDSDGTFALAIGGISNTFGASQAIALGLYGSDFSSLKAGDVFLGNDTDNLLIGTYNLDDGTNTIQAITMPEGNNICTITAIDHTARKISGTYAFQAFDDTDPGTVYQISAGVFTDIPIE